MTTTGAQAGRHATGSIVMDPASVVGIWSAEKAGRYTSGYFDGNQLRACRGHDHPDRASALECVEKALARRMVDRRRAMLALVHA